MDTIFINLAQIFAEVSHAQMENICLQDDILDDGRDCAQFVGSG